MGAGGALNGLLEDFWVWVGLQGVPVILEGSWFECLYWIGVPGRH